MARFIPLITVCAFIAITGYWLFYEATNPWVTVLKQETGQNVRRDILTELPAPGVGITPGYNVELLGLRTAARTMLYIDVVEGTFDENIIQPESTWKNITQKATLVNSVDEHHKSVAGISYFIARGCDLLGLEGDRAQIGEIVFSECNGPYRESMGITQVANAAIIVWSADDERTRCPRITGRSSLDDEDYQACIASTIESSLRDLFTRLQREEKVNVLILPALGTGIGRFRIEKFYAVLEKVLKTQIEDSIQAAGLPNRIVLLIWNQWDSGRLNRWQVARSALADFGSSLSDFWSINSQKFRSLNTPSNLFGISIALFCILIVQIFNPKITSGFFPTAFESEPSKAIQLVVAWTVASFGVLSLAHVILPLDKILESSIVLEVIIGAFAVPLVVFVLKGEQTLQDSVFPGSASSK